MSHPCDYEGLVSTFINIPVWGLGSFLMSSFISAFFFFAVFAQLENLVYYNRLKNSKIVISDFHLAKLENGLIKEPCGTPEYLGKRWSVEPYWSDTVMQGPPGNKQWCPIMLLKRALPISSTNCTSLPRRPASLRPDCELSWWTIRINHRWFQHSNENHYFALPYSHVQSTHSYTACSPPSAGLPQVFVINHLSPYGSRERRLTVAQRMGCWKEKTQVKVPSI